MKESIFTFSKTVQGYRHIQEGIPCQDSSGKYPDILVSDQDDSGIETVAESIVMDEPMASEIRDGSSSVNDCEPERSGIEQPVEVEIETSVDTYSTEANECNDGYEDSYFSIIAVADGHGDPACHRSNKGSRFAVNVGLQCLKGFASAIIKKEMSFECPRQRFECLQQLTSSIIAKWHEEVQNDLQKNGVTEEDIADAGCYEESYKEGDCLDHLYGTTLIAALYVEDFLILIQQGDGRCDVFYEDGTVDQPIPWDMRCKGSTTTSMCDKDAVISIRSKVINLTEKRVVACFVGSDGVEDSYYDNELSQLGTHRFYMDLVCKIHELDADDFDSYLDNMLPEFSKHGSGDDVSVAGVVDLHRTKILLDGYKSKVEEYDHRELLRINLEEAKSRVISMTRKHGFLKEQIEEAQKSIKSVKSQYDQLIREHKKLKAKYERIEEDYKKALRDLEEYKRESENIAVEHKKTWQPNTAVYIMDAIIMTVERANQFIHDEFGRNIAQRNAMIRSQSKQLQILQQKVIKNEDNQKALTVRLSDLEEKLKQANIEFDKFDSDYQENVRAVQKYEQELTGMEEI